MILQSGSRMRKLTRGSPLALWLAESSVNPEVSL
jgi:hypothetical protein